MLKLLHKACFMCLIFHKDGLIPVCVYWLPVGKHLVTASSNHMITMHGIVRKFIN